MSSSESKNALLALGMLAVSMDFIRPLVSLGPMPFIVALIRSVFSRMAMTMGKLPTLMPILVIVVMMVIVPMLMVFSATMMLMVWMPSVIFVMPMMSMMPMMPLIFMRSMMPVMPVMFLWDFWVPLFVQSKFQRIKDSLHVWRRSQFLKVLFCYFLSYYLQKICVQVLLAPLNIGVKHLDSMVERALLPNQPQDQGCQNNHSYDGAFIPVLIPGVDCQLILAVFCPGHYKYDYKLLEKVRIYYSAKKVLGGSNVRIFLLDIKNLQMSFNEDERQRINKQAEIRAETKEPKTYLDLIEKVGHSGKYQLRLVVFFSIVNFVTGIVLLSTAFLFRKRGFECKANGLIVSQSDCLDYICQLPATQWVQYLAREDNNYESLATSPQYYCQNHALLDVLSSSTYFGAFVGYLVISSFADNMGRRASVIIGWGICLLGTVIVAANFSIYMAAVGMFLAGFGCDVVLNIAFFFFGEVVGEEKREKFSVFVQLWFPLGGITLTLFFYLFDNWRVIFIILVTVPTAIDMVLLYLMCYETPQFLTKTGAQNTAKVLNKIGMINLGIDNIVSTEDVEKVMAAQMTGDFGGKIITPVDLCRFPSLRVITISACMVCFCTYAMYYGPALIIDEIGFNIYLSNIVINLSELCTLIPSYFVIQMIERRKWGVILFTVCIVCSMLLTFIKKPEDEDLSIQAIFEVIIVFIFRGSISFYFCYFQIYVCQLFPARARGIGSGVVSACGTLASTLSPIYLGYLKRAGINPMTIFVLFGIIGISNIILMDETKGKPLKDEIDEIELEKQKRRSEVDIHGGSRARSPIKESQAKKSQLTSEKVNQSGCSGK